MGSGVGVGWLRWGVVKGGVFVVPAGHLCEPHGWGGPAAPEPAGGSVRQAVRFGGAESGSAGPAGPHHEGTAHTCNHPPTPPPTLHGSPLFVFQLKEAALIRGDASEQNRGSDLEARLTDSYTVQVAAHAVLTQLRSFCHDLSRSFRALAAYRPHL